MAAGKLRAVAGAAETETKSVSSALFARFERGEIGVDEYLDARASEAVAPYEGKLPAERIAWLKGMLREQLETDPVLSERVRQATGRAPQAR
ncbi:MAG: hypothetical protein ABI548_29190 [Polyangiaceae bacterium]